jgi:transcription-repair coupling factor (superfamily II helicase)
MDRGQFWFAQEKAGIRTEARNPLSWWAANYKEIEVDQRLPLSEFSRTLYDWGYQKVVVVRSPGEFGTRGGILDVFPINEAHAWRVEMDGNTVGAILPLPDISTDPQLPLSKTITKPATLATASDAKAEREYRQMLASLREGAFVVHVDHGIARFKGFEKKTPSHESKKEEAIFSPFRKQQPKKKQEEEQPDETPAIDLNDYLVLEYAENDILRVPASAIGRVTPYIGFTDPTLTRLGGNLWEKTKRKIKEDLLQTAQELVRIYASRELAQKTPYRIDEGLERAIESSFQYKETPDQEAAIEAVRQDLAGSIPMDRVICADVGFGKTEVALRAAAYAVAAGHQVALVAPTTILAHQHYKTFEERFSKTGYPVVIKKLTRIEGKQSQKETLAQLAANRCDIVIGTHRLLQKDVAFSNLGLLIVDEEQRFGVKQKEEMKRARASMDVLSLSATPIPRTLSFALSGLRDMSTITTPPLGRKPITTIVKRYDDALVKQAITDELARGGQVYYLHNRIMSLGKTLHHVQKLVPKARVSFLHAKLSEAELIRRIDEFTAGAIDVLISTTIMENGLDLANANTLIVEDATKLGLAQAHQIRGRIGRGDAQAFAYFLHPNRKMPPKAKERLAALEDSQMLGSGYQIALRDLEIRGAGNFLGREQSGHIARVGFNLYCQLLNEAIMELKKS